MLKQFLKTLFIGVLSSMLTINPVVAQVASDTKSYVTTDSDGTKSAHVGYKFQGVKDSDMIASITMLATGFIASRLLVKYKPVSNDMMVAGAAGAAFIAGEVMSNMKFKGTMEEKTAELVLKKGSTPNQEQIEYLQKLKESYEEAKKATQTKKMLQMAAAAAFAVAGATAAYMAYTEYAAFAACKAEITAATGVLTPLTGTGGCSVAAACITALQTFDKEMDVLNTLRQKPAPTKEKLPEVKTPMAAAEKSTKVTMPGACGTGCGAPGLKPLTTCSGALANQTLNQAVNYTPDKPFFTHDSNQLLNKILYPQGMPVFSYEQMQSKEFDSSIFEKSLNFLFPKAQASWLPMLGLTGGAALGYFGGAYAGLGIETDMFMFVPFNRVIAWGTLGALSLLAAKSSDNTLKKLDENIAKIDKILNEMNNLQKAIATQNVKGMGIQVQAVDPMSQNLPSYSVDNKTKSPCMTSNATSNCSSLEEQMKNMPGYSQLPPSFQTLATQSTKMADGLSGSTGISGAGMSAANSLAGKQNAINGLLKKTQNAYNDLLKKNKKNPVNFEKEQEKLYNRMAASVRKGLQQKGTTAAGFMASYGGAPLDSSKIGKPVDLGMDKKTDAPAMAAVGGAPAEEKKDEMDFQFEDAPALAENAAAGGADKAEYDVTTDEIHKDNGPSLFELISNRYLQSGYPKLLEEEPTKK